MARSIVCVSCGLDITKTPKIRRNLGADYKGDHSEVRERVLYLWKELLQRHGHEITCSESNLRMCRTCFNKYHKLSLDICALSEKLEASLKRLPGYTKRCTEEPCLLRAGRKRRLATQCDSESTRKKCTTKPPVMLSTDSASPQVMV